MNYNALPVDRPGRYVLVKDVETNHYWSLSWSPTNHLVYDFYECHHGQGYTTIITEIYNIRGEITYFVPIDTNCEIWKVRLINLDDRPRQLEIYSFVELLMGNALNDLINQPNDKHFTEIYFHQQYQSLCATRRYWVLNKGVSVKQPNIDWRHEIYFSSTLSVTGFDSSLDAFIGKWRSEANPQAVVNSAMSNSEITAGDPIAALQNKVTISAQETIEFAITMEVVDKGTTPELTIHRSINLIDQKFQQIQNYWQDYFSHVQIETPNPKMNLMVNVWNQYQAAVTFDMARNLGYYHGGLLFGTGMRDRFQDILGVVMIAPDKVRTRLLKALQFQFADGSTLHNFFTLTNTGEKTNHSDTPLWIPFGVMEYLNETADFSILDEVINYHDRGAGTVYEHLLRAVDYAISIRSERGLVRIFNGDWNDTLDHVGSQGKGETTWGTCFLGYTIAKIMPLLEWKQDQENLTNFQAVYAELKAVLNELCWDGNWYLRAFRDNGEAIGTNAQAQGKIFLNAQSWAVISGLASPERINQCLRSCQQWLETPYGMQIVAPSFTEIDDSIGLISRCVAGKKENGAVFNHASSWFVLASILGGEVEYAYSIYNKMLPLNSAQPNDRYEVEPYVFAEYVTSPDHPTQGQASHSWLTGTAVWMLRIATDYIIGLRPCLAGMIIDPHIPKEWQSFSAIRKFRNKTIHLRVANPSGKNSGVSSLTVNGQAIEGNLIKLSNQFLSETDLEVLVTL
jgi:cellobiose phosphorylase